MQTDVSMQDYGSIAILEDNIRAMAMEKIAKEGIELSHGFNSHDRIDEELDLCFVSDDRSKFWRCVADDFLSYHPHSDEDIRRIVTSNMEVFDQPHLTCYIHEVTSDPDFGLDHIYKCLFYEWCGHVAADEFNRYCERRGFRESTYERKPSCHKIELGQAILMLQKEDGVGDLDYEVIFMSPSMAKLELSPTEDTVPVKKRIAIVESSSSHITEGVSHDSICVYVNPPEDDGFYLFEVLQSVLHITDESIEKLQRFLLGQLQTPGLTCDKFFDFKFELEAKFN